MATLCSAVTPRKLYSHFVLAMQMFTENVTKFSSKQVISNSILLEKKQRSVWETQRCPVFPPRDTVVPMAQWCSFPGSTQSL